MAHVGMVPVKHTTPLSQYNKVHLGLVVGRAHHFPCLIVLINSNFTKCACVDVLAYMQRK